VRFNIKFLFEWWLKPTDDNNFIRFNK